MLQYETLVLAVPEITADESASLEKQFEQIIKKEQGLINSFERWGKYRLAYPVRNNDYGVYFLVRFQAKQEVNLGSLFKDIDSFFMVKHGSIIMRHLTSKLSSKQPIAYFKPESLEDMPTQDVDTFLRDNKMKGLLNNNASSHDKHVDRISDSVLDEDDLDEDSESD